VPQGEKGLTRFSQVGACGRTSTFPQNADLVYSVRLPLPKVFRGLRILHPPYTAGVKSIIANQPQKCKESYGSFGWK